MRAKETSRCGCVDVASSPDSLALVLSGARMTIPGARESGDEAMQMREWSEFVAVSSVIYF